MYDSRYSDMSLPRYMEMMAGGASQAPRRKSLPGDAIAMRIRSPFWETGERKREYRTGW
jgi:hypothetical protein